jgi:hypothetical protein
MKYPQMEKDFSSINLSEGAIAIVHDKEDSMIYYLFRTDFPVEEFGHTRFIAGLDEFGCVVRVAVPASDPDVTDELVKHCHVKRMDELALRMVDIPTIARNSE